jgi:subtilase family serine protease
MRLILKAMAIGSAALMLLAGVAGAAVPPEEIVLTCPADSVLSGTGCMDKYEASVWRVPNATTNQALVAKIQQGTATVASLMAGGATQLGDGANDYAPCEGSGRSCANGIYAVSVPDVRPSVFLTWFQAQQACANAGKRLPSNAEWQAAVAGTRDPGPDDGATDCNTASGRRIRTGSRSGCVSAVGAFDMVGNVTEWVADWGPRSLACRQWSTKVSPTGDAQCLVGVRTTEEPGAWMRGGQYETMSSGPLAIEAENGPSRNGPDVGFRCIGTAIAMVASPDLIEAAVTTGPPAPSQAPGTTFSVTDTVENLGPGPSGPSITRYYLSLDAVRGPGDILSIGARAVPALAPEASHSGTVIVTIPATTPLNTYFLLACADELATVAETDEGNNCSGSPAAIVTVARPDLVAMTVATDPPAPARAPGTTVSVTDTIKDVGLAPSGPSVTRYYLSLDSVKGAGDILLIGARAVPALAAGASQSGTVAVAIPATPPLNTYFLLACADDLNAVVETNEGNNCVASATPIVTVTRPDLVEHAVTAPPVTKARGATFAMSDTAQNLGAVASAPSVTRYYLSLDAVKSAGDILLIGARAVPALAAGGSHSATVTLTIPTTTPLNSYFLLACADDLSAVIETNEGNNCGASPTAVVTVAGPDLAETAVTTNPPAPSQAPGTTFSVTDTVHNGGPVASGASVTRYYLSLDAVKSVGDILLIGGRAVPALAAGGNSSGTVALAIPTTTPLNSYFLLACADDLSAVVETNEANNCIASPTAIITVTRPDMVEETISAPPATKARGTTFPITDTAQNLGAAASGPSVTRYYLSLDGVKSTGDPLLIGGRAVPALAAGGSHSGTVTVGIPATTPANTYFLLACADDLNAVVETNEGNNCKPSSTSMTVTP